MSCLHAARSGRRHRARQVHWSNFQLTRVELSTPDAKTKIVTRCERKPRFHKLVSELVACGRDETRKGGREEPRRLHWTSDKRTTTQDSPLDEQKTRKLKTNSVVASERPRQSSQEPRNEDFQQKVLWEESLSLWDGQRKRRESAGGSGQLTPFG